jgi:hypothetical protein
LLVEWQRWVKSGKAQIEHKFSGLPPAADIRQRGWHVGSVPGPDSCSATNEGSPVNNLFDQLIGAQ